SRGAGSSSWTWPPRTPARPWSRCTGTRCCWAWTSGSRRAACPPGSSGRRRSRTGWPKRPGGSTGRTAGTSWRDERCHRVSAVSDYAKGTQRLARDLAAELDGTAETSRAAMWKLRKLPQMHRVDVWVRARMVSRHLKRARDLAQGISAEAVKFHVLYRREFLD